MKAEWVYVEGRGGRGVQEEALRSFSFLFVRHILSRPPKALFLGNLVGAQRHAQAVEPQTTQASMALFRFLADAPAGTQC